MLDPTKIVPEELVPLRPVGKMVLNRNPDNFFAETEQVAFATHHIIPGIDFSNDPLLQGRNHSYLDTQLSRLGGPNFHELPINASVVQVHNNQRDGMHRQAIPRGRVSLTSRTRSAADVRSRPARWGSCRFPSRFATTSCAASPKSSPTTTRRRRLFYKSQTPVEQNHIVEAFRFELTKVANAGDSCAHGGRP